MNPWTCWCPTCPCGWVGPHPRGASAAPRAACGAADRQRRRGCPPRGQRSATRQRQLLAPPQTDQHRPARRPHRNGARRQDQGGTIRTPDTPSVASRASFFRQDAPRIVDEGGVHLKNGEERVVPACYLPRSRGPVDPLGERPHWQLSRCRLRHRERFDLP